MFNVQKNIQLQAAAGRRLEDYFFG